MMKKILLSMAVLSYALAVHATSFFDQLVEFNSNWSNYQDRVPDYGAIIIPTDQIYIQTHLSQVLNVLESNPTTHLTEKQLEMRVQLIDILEGYKNEGLFPMNYYRSERIPVFIDEHNTHCAVGYLLQKTGYEHVARRISEKNNYAWVKEIDDPALPIWQEMSGFTMDELKLIQGAYDSYLPMAFTLPNKTEVPQKPDVVVRNFEGEEIEHVECDDLMKIWCFGEGKDGILHGRWVQNYAKDVPWIIGFYENGNRTGSWKEYYQGTDILCRTEHWRNDKLNGVRTRYDRSGNVIERITFKDGEAIEKINYDLEGGLKWVRTPLIEDRVQTEVFTELGYLLASGEEVIYNPSGLLWFQNIELTALNTFAITARDGAPSYVSEQPSFFSPLAFQQPSLVQYNRVGEWKFYNEYTPESYLASASTTREYLERDFPHFGSEIANSIRYMEIEEVQQSFDSLKIQYNANDIVLFEGLGNATAKISISYQDHQTLDLSMMEWQYNRFESRPSVKVVKSIGMVNENGARIGNWLCYDPFGRLIKKEEYLIPWISDNSLEASGNNQ